MSSCSAVVSSEEQKKTDTKEKFSKEWPPVSIFPCGSLYYESWKEMPFDGNEDRERSRDRSIM
jgi:hypothetical protein